MSDRHVALIVEDDPAIMEAEKTLVLSLGHEPRCATTLEEARAEIAKNDLCYALIDMQIPTHTGGAPIVGAGETLLGDLRKYDSRRNARGRFMFPVLVVSGYSRDPEFVSRMYEADASGFIAKPFGDKLELVLDKIRGALEKAGRVEHGACCARSDASASVAGETASAAATAPVALLHSHDARGTALTMDELKAIVAKRRDYDLFLDFTAPVAGGYLASRKNAKGKHEDATLMPSGAAMLAELVAERKPLRAMGMKCVRHGGIGAPTRAIERARKLVDVNVGRFAWRAIKTITHMGGDDTNKEFVFDPPPDMTFAVVVKG